MAVVRWQIHRLTYAELALQLAWTTDWGVLRGLGSLRNDYVPSATRFV